MSDGDFSDFMSFRTLISTAWIKIVYAIGAVVITLSGISVFFVMANQGLVGTGMFFAAAYLVVGNIAWRVMCELVMLFFSMHEQLVKLTKLTEGQTFRTTDGPAIAPRPAIAPATTPHAATGGIPTMVSEAYDAWTGGDSEAFSRFIRHLESVMDVLPSNISASFLRTRFRQAAGIPEFESVLRNRA